jgi:hypothetical protein
MNFLYVKKIALSPYLSEAFLIFFDDRVIVVNLESLHLINATAVEAREYYVEPEVRPVRAAIVISCEIVCLSRNVKSLQFIDYQACELFFLLLMGFKILILNLV